jgi:hypothetical protein
MNQQRKESALHLIRTHLIILSYILQLLFIAMYSQPEVQPFVYVRF